MTDASRIPYAAGEPGDWTQYPADVAQALDELRNDADANATSITGKVAYSDIKGPGIVVAATLPDFENRTITAGSGVVVTNGNGVSGNPTIAAIADGAYYYAGTASSTFTTSERDVPFDTATRTASWLSVSSGAFTVSADGVYMISASINANQNGTSTLSSWYARLLIDSGSGYSEDVPCRTSGVHDNGVHDWQSGSMSTVLALDNGDSFKIAGARASGSATFEWRGGLGYCHIAIVRLS